MDTVLGEFGVNARRPVGAAATLMNVADTRLEDIVGLPAPRRLTVSPRIEPAQGDAEHAGHRGGAIAGLIRSHELERFRVPSRSPERTRPRPFAVSRALHAAGDSHDEDDEAPRARRSSTHRLGDPRRDRPGGPSYGWSGRALELAGELADRAPRANQLHHLVAKLRRVRQVCSWHRGFLLPKGFGIPKAGQLHEPFLAAHEHAPIVRLNERQINRVGRHYREFRRLIPRAGLRQFNYLGRGRK